MSRETQKEKHRQHRAWTTLRSKTTWRVALTIVLVGLILDLLLQTRVGTSALVYLGIPVLVSVLIYRAVDDSQPVSPTRRFLNHIAVSLIIFLVVSIGLGEGNICVLMFMPIYYFVLVAVYLARMFDQAAGGSSQDRYYAKGTLVILTVLSLEGVAEPISFSRDTAASYSLTTSVDIDTLKRNIARPIVLNQERHWFLRLFPLPTRVEAGSLAAGDIHQLSFVYKRWFVTNVHEGDMRLRIAEVGSHRIRTEVVENTSYLANYLRIKGTEIEFTETADGRTGVTLTVDYHRLLDPYWYFGPLQHLAVEQSAKYLIETVILREHADA